MLTSLNSAKRLFALGWHIQYIDQEDELRKQKMKQRAKQEKDDEERMNDLLQRQIERYVRQSQVEAFYTSNLQGDGEC